MIKTIATVFTCTAFLFAADPALGIFKGTPKEIPSVFGGLRPGMLEKEASTVNGELYTSGYSYLSDYEGADIYVTNENKIITQLSVHWASSVKPLSEDFLVKSWGKPLTRDTENGIHSYWADQSNNMLLEYISGNDEDGFVNVNYTYYKPLITLFSGNEPSIPSAFKCNPIGKTMAEFAKLNPSVTEYGTFTLGDFGYSGYVMLTQDDKEKIKEITLDILDLDQSYNEMKKRWGEPKAAEYGQATYWTNSEGINFVVHSSNEDGSGKYITITKDPVE